MCRFPLTRGVDGSKRRKQASRSGLLTEQESVCTGTRLVPLVFFLRRTGRSGLPFSLWKISLTTFLLETEQLGQNVPLMKRQAIVAITAPCWPAYHAVDWNQHYGIQSDKKTTEAPPPPSLGERIRRGETPRPWVQFISVVGTGEPWWPRKTRTAHAKSASPLIPDGQTGMEFLAHRDGLQERGRKCRCPGNNGDGPRSTPRLIRGQGLGL